MKRDSESDIFVRCYVFVYKWPIKIYTGTVLRTIPLTKHQFSRDNIIVNKNNKLVAIVRNN